MGKFVLRKRFDFPDAAAETAAWLRSPDFHLREVATVEVSERDDGWWIYLRLEGPFVNEATIADAADALPGFERVD
ncbi:hypothetical protein HRJ34_15525 [Rhizorhabdus wittichii]|uniref:Uncharacterized protein n=1 Tax=Rhizorhabdus wittichii TaxID=160791 RepID=A0A975CXV3_9SPHN|nr:hypothetical protein [Rhizorhabdus wittichii]QTH19775.1 hypothetical protein HRJ34_15525 [Rhizorhabdus wittichii]